MIADPQNSEVTTENPLVALLVAEKTIEDLRESLNKKNAQIIDLNNRIKRLEQLLSGDVTDEQP